MTEPKRTGARKLHSTGCPWPLGKCTCRAIRAAIEKGMDAGRKAVARTISDALAEPQARKPLEHDIQRAFFAWAEDQKSIVPELGLLYAIPNGGKRSKAVAGKLKAEGVKAGVLDVHLPVQRGPFIGLWLEFKTDSGGLTQTQKDWMARLQAEGHCCVLVRSHEAAQKAVLDYLQLGRRNLV